LFTKIIKKAFIGLLGGGQARFERKERGCSAEKKGIGEGPGPEKMGRP